MRYFKVVYLILTTSRMRYFKILYLMMTKSRISLHKLCAVKFFPTFQKRVPDLHKSLYMFTCMYFELSYFLYEIDDRLIFICLQCLLLVTTVKPIKSNTTPFLDTISSFIINLKTLCSSTAMVTVRVLQLAMVTTSFTMPHRPYHSSNHIRPLECNHTCSDKAILGHVI